MEDDLKRRWDDWAPDHLEYDDWCLTMTARAEAEEAAAIDAQNEADLAGYGSDTPTIITNLADRVSDVTADVGINTARVTAVEESLAEAKAQSDANLMAQAHLLYQTEAIVAEAQAMRVASPTIADSYAVRQSPTAPMSAFVVVMSDGTSRRFEFIYNQWGRIEGTREVPRT
jgi:hypothetical protein